MIRLRYKLVIIAVVGMAFFQTNHTHALNTNWYVTPSGSNSNDCTSWATACGTIQGAIAKAASGDTISLAPGSYYENINIDKDILIQGYHASSTIIDGNHIDRVVMVGASNNVTLSNLTLQNGVSTGEGGGIYAANSTILTLSHVVVQGNSGVDGGGIYTCGSLTMSDSSVKENNASQEGGAVYICGAAQFSAINSEFSNNTSVVAGGGILSYGETILKSSSVSGNLSGTFGGGGIYSSNTLELEDVIIDGNTATSNQGGGISISGILKMEKSILSNNTGPTGGGIYIVSSITNVTITNSAIIGNTSTNDVGGGIRNWEGTITLDRVLFKENYGDSLGGGAIFNYGGTYTISNSTFEDNYAPNYGGAINNWSGTMTILGSTFVGNTAGAAGAIDNRADLSILNSTISGNEAIYWAGAIDNHSNLNISSTTISNNSSPSIGNGIYNSGTINIVNSILSGNSISNCRNNTGTIISQGHNLENQDTCEFLSPGDLSNIDPRLMPLMDNGGSTLTHALQVNSPAIDMGDNSACPIEDQRGKVRPVGPQCDIGAYEGGVDTTLKSVNAPRLALPKGSIITNNATPNFSWSNTPNAQRYEIVFATDRYFLGIIHANNNAISAYTPPAFTDGTYFWRVRAYNTGDQPGTWSSSRVFTIDTAGPLIPILNSPINETSESRTPIFRWYSSNTATSYEFQYDDDLGFANPNYTVAVRGTSRKPPAMSNGTYFWRVRAKDAAGNWGDWSTPFTINIIR